MKIAIFAFVIGLCLLGANVQGNVVEVEEFSGDLVDVQTFGFLGVIKAALRTVKGLNCTIKEVLAVKAAAQTFISDVQACGGQVSQKVQNVINQCNTIINICNNILNLNDTVCNNSDESDDGPPPAKNCTVQLVKQIFSLYKNIKKGISMIKNIPSAGSSANDCVNDAANKLSTQLGQFTSDIKTCSQLTSN